MSRPITIDREGHRLVSRSEQRIDGLENFATATKIRAVAAEQPSALELTPRETLPFAVLGVLRQWMLGESSDPRRLRRREAVAQRPGPFARSVRNAVSAGRRPRGAAVAAAVIIELAFGQRAEGVSVLGAGQVVWSRAPSAMSEGAQDLDHHQLGGTSRKASQVASARPSSRYHGGLARQSTAHEGVHQRRVEARHRLGFLEPQDRRRRQEHVVVDRFAPKERRVGFVAIVMGARIDLQAEALNSLLSNPANGRLASMARRPSCRSR